MIFYHVQSILGRSWLGDTNATCLDNTLIVGNKEQIVMPLRGYIFLKNGQTILWPYCLHTFRPSYIRKIVVAFSMLLGNRTYSQPQSCYVVTQTKHLTTPWAKQIDTDLVQEHGAY
jgi:hypothetical protein